MNIQCPKCKLKYKIESSVVFENGRMIECVNCHNIFLASRMEAEGIEKVVDNLKDDIEKWDEKLRKKEEEIMLDLDEKEDIVDIRDIKDEEFEKMFRDVLDEMEEKGEEEEEGEIKRREEEIEEIKEPEKEPIQDMATTESIAEDGFDVSIEERGRKEEIRELLKEAREVAESVLEERPIMEEGEEAISEKGIIEEPKQEIQGIQEIIEEEMAVPEPLKASADFDISTKETIEPPQPSLPPQEGGGVLRTIFREKITIPSKLITYLSSITKIKEWLFKPKERGEKLYKIRKTPSLVMSSAAGIALIILVAVGYLGYSILKNIFTPEPEEVFIQSESEIMPKPHGEVMPKPSVPEVKDEEATLEEPTPEESTPDEEQSAEERLMRRFETTPDVGDKITSPTLEEKESLPVEKESTTVEEDKKITYSIPESLIVKMGSIIPIAYNAEETRIMSMIIRLELDTNETAMEVRENIPIFEGIIEETVNTFFRDNFYEDIHFVQDKLKDTIIAQLNKSLVKGTIKGIEFEDFLVQ
ncbi:MAG: zinc-ribbon domain-containing protein [Nitrospinae bacterium]|nr:zinc-ribbon domain-containing protein [Nitrospinota bacterium]